MRIFALSDLHTDFPENFAWVSGLSDSDYKDDVLILAGDIGHSLEVIVDTFRLLSKKFYRVFFLPGNHDLWTVDYVGDSLDKERDVLAAAHDAGIETSPSVVGDTLIVPLYGWYDLSFGKPSEKLNEAWQDFIWCRWPDDMTLSKVTDYFLKRNLPVTQQPGATRVITFSHYLPRIDVMPSYIPENHRIVYPVLGSEKLDKQLREWGSTLHIYGHSHVNREVTLDGVTYINNALGYPRETRICSREMLDLMSLSGM